MVYMKFRMNFGIVKTVILAVIVAGALAIIGVDIAMLAGENTAEPAIAGVSLGAATLIAVAALLVLFNSYYKFKDNQLVTVLGFFVDRINYDDVVCVKQNGETKEIFLITTGVKPTDGDISFRVNVSAQKTDDFIAALRGKIGDIIVEIFTPEKKDKNKK